MAIKSRPFRAQAHCILVEFYQKYSWRRQDETSQISDSLINYNEIPTTVVALTDDIKKKVSEMLQKTLEQWCNCSLEQTAFYGIRGILHW